VRFLVLVNLPLSTAYEGSLDPVSAGLRNHCETRLG
jgi:hypothetical protein